MKDEKLMNKSKVQILKNCDEEDNNISISGKVINECDGRPIPLACIKFTDKNYNPLYHCFTDTQGYFYIKEYFLDTIRIIVSKKGYKIFSSSIYSIKDYELKNLVVQISPRCEIERIITGVVCDCNYNPAENVHVILRNEDNNTIHSTYTNKNGIFVVDDVEHGYYTIIFCSYMYYKYSYNFIFDYGKIMPLGETCIRKKDLKGTLNGIITDKEGNPINEAIVVLFDEVDNWPLQFTRTNEKGVYLFYNLDVGRYFIVSNKSESKEINIIKYPMLFDDYMDYDY
ncbi:MSCRAMM family protein [Oceanirhabdus sp. W0125-5]|uniref:MSCRAMM family protein n=1 Tax=Oceanirhabdus sp. W0125-5 TaxID=2999116 RepID=UPI0022F33BF7|nr:carboxypeptidase-like regulatory domain-containing protein [Oceanirhabdus sp. W0125-5]WBW97737.1 carboxypeptidase-like regulatory domain-containing protein [Oceanirhabdus sp. W0125-5]